jgi:4-amino-4-deoxy-L-arabinose transferase-like glycosyltransferase
MTESDPTLKPASNAVLPATSAVTADAAPEVTGAVNAALQDRAPQALTALTALTATPEAEPPQLPALQEEKPSGNPFRSSAVAPLTVGVLGAVLLMSHRGHVRFGIPLGFLFVVIATFGLLDLFGTFDDPQREQGESFGEPISGVRLFLPLLRTVALCCGFLGSVAAAQANLTSPWLLGPLVALSFIATIASLFQVGVTLGVFAVDEAGKERSLLRRQGFWVLSLGALLYLPTLGIFSLWDPWETHYGEVAREILARDDWISLWWAQDGWFWSKPILNFWIQSLAMGSLGTHFEAGSMMSGFGGAGVAHPEWVVRMPNVMLTLVSMYVLYKGVANIFGRRAGLLGSIALATMPYWYFLAHQTMTDMPFVAPMSAAMGFLLLGLNTDPEKKVRTYPVTIGTRVVQFSAFHVAFGVVALAAIPQILYLVSRHIELSFNGGSRPFRIHFDEFVSGSALNCSTPGNEACRQQVPAMAARAGNSAARFFLGFEPLLQGLVWAVCLATLLQLNRGERRTQRLFYIAAWLCAALATMGKGPAGIVLPGASAFLYVLCTKRFSEFLRLETWSGFLVIACVAAPWFVAMYVRHGSPFIDRLFIHDMFNRTLGHVHDTNEGDDTSFRFYIWQLGYGIFPWTGLAPLGLTYFARRKDSALQGGAAFLAVWFAFAFFLFSFMGTKFHHYIFPAVPPTAMLIGIALDDMLGRGEWLAKGSTASVFKSGLLSGGALAAGALVTLGAALPFAGGILGNTAGKPMVAVGLGVFAAGVALIFGWIWMYPAQSSDTGLLRDPRAPDTAKLGRPAGLPLATLEAHDLTHTERQRSQEILTGAAVLSGLGILILVGRDLASKGDSADQPGVIRLLQLFTYNYKRPWPTEGIDFSAAMQGIVIASIVFTLLLATRAARKHAVFLFSAFAIVVAVWGIDVYMVKVSPHWGQHEVIEAYYRDRKGDGEQLVAYQMNWKGENFYAANRIPAFVSSGATFTAWLKQQREKGQTVMYFVTEHSRLGGLRSEVGARAYKELTDRKLNNKFVLVRAEL